MVDIVAARRERPVIVVLQDGRQLDGTLHVYEGGFVVEGVRFAAWEIDDLVELDA